MKMKLCMQNDQNHSSFIYQFQSYQTPYGRSWGRWGRDLSNHIIRRSKKKRDWDLRYHKRKRNDWRVFFLCDKVRLSHVVIPIVMFFFVVFLTWYASFEIIGFDCLIGYDLCKQRLREGEGWLSLATSYRHPLEPGLSNLISIKKMMDVCQIHLVSLSAPFL